MKKLTQILDKILEAVLCVMIVFMVFGCVWQIITRFIIQDPSDWTEEFVRYTLIWTTMLGVPYAYGKDKFAYQIADYLTQHFAEQHSLDELAAHFYISKFYMCRLFRKVVGYSVSEYLTILRVQKACEYLEKTKLSVSAIAERVGYNSLTHFEREFKRYTQVSPLRYRNTQYTVTAFDVTTDFTPQGQPLPQEES